MSVEPSAITRDPDSVSDYVFDWTAWLDGDTITAHNVTVDPVDGLTVDSSTHTDTAVTVWLSGGTADTDTKVSCEITTAGGRTDERTVLFRTRER